MYARLTGYGQNDKRAGHDAQYLSESGLLNRFRPDERSPPVFPGNIVADYCAGSLATFVQILQKLKEREYF